MSIRTLVQSANPVKCFSMLQTETGIPLPQIYRIVSHLLYWKRAKIIDKLTKLNTYVLNPKKNMDSFLSLEEKFNLEFSNTSFREVNFRDILDVYVTLHPLLFTYFYWESSLLIILYYYIYSIRFSVPRKLGENIERIAQGKSQLRIQFVEAVTWFLRHGLLKPVHSYIFLVLPTGEGSSTLTLPPSNACQSPSLSSSSHSPSLHSTFIQGPLPQNHIPQAAQSQTPQQSASQSPCGPSPTSPSALSRRPLLRHALKMPLFKPEVNYALTPTPLTPEEEMEISKFDDDSATFKLFKKYEQ